MSLFTEYPPQPEEVQRLVEKALKAPVVTQEMINVLHDEYEECEDWLTEEVNSPSDDKEAQDMLNMAVAFKLAHDLLVLKSVFQGAPSV